MYIDSESIIQRADCLVNVLGTRDPKRIAKLLDITVMPCHFKVQRGAYKVILKNRFIFIKDDMDPVMENVVLLHEIAHDMLHRKEAVAAGGFQDFDVLDMRDVRMEYEANLFAAEVALPDDDLWAYVLQGYDAKQIAALMGTDANFVGMKVDLMHKKGYRLNTPEFRGNFLREG